MKVLIFVPKLLRLKAIGKNMKHLVCLFMLIASSAYADSIYKWVDEDGNTHYGDVPPPSVHTEELRVDVVPGNPGKALPRLETSDLESSSPASGTPDSSSSDSAQPDSEMTDDQAEAICKQARQEIKYLNEAKHRARVRYPDGTSRHISTEERKARREHAKQDIKDYCK
jgi:hypothetical protein